MKTHWLYLIILGGFAVLAVVVILVLGTSSPGETVGALAALGGVAVAALGILTGQAQRIDAQRQAIFEEQLKAYTEITAAIFEVSHFLYGAGLAPKDKERREGFSDWVGRLDDLMFRYLPVMPQKTYDKLRDLQIIYTGAEGLLEKAKGSLAMSEAYKSSLDKNVELFRDMVGQFQTDLRVEKLQLETLKLTE